MNGHKSLMLWFTGLSGAGKSTLSNLTEAYLYKQGMHTIVLDGDNIRHGLCKDLGFSDSARKENIRRIGEVGKLTLELGIITLVACISPFREDRQLVRAMVAPGDFIEIFCNASLAVCEQRDPKGLYKRARAKRLHEFTGISSPYEIPDHPELILDTGGNTEAECLNQIVTYLGKHHLSLSQ